jgi:FMN reductase
VSTRHLVGISAGMGQPSATRLLTDRLLEAASRALGERGVAAEASAVELRDHAHDITNALLTAVPTGGLRALIDEVADADGLVVVSPIFNASYSGLFKMFFDILEPDILAGKPVLVAATGGTPRHSLALEHALRPMFSHLRAVTVPTAVYAATEDWGAGGTGAEDLVHRIARAGGELAELVAAREPARRFDPYAEPVPFERLLAG